MSFEEKLKLINKFDNLIRKKVSGNACYYANKLGLSRSAFFRLLESMREEFNIPIVYSSEDQRYEYLKEGIMYFGFISCDLISSENLKRISGGGILIEINLKVFLIVPTSGTMGRYL